MGGTKVCVRSAGKGGVEFCGRPNVWRSRVVMNKLSEVARRLFGAFLCRFADEYLT